MANWGSWFGRIVRAGQPQQTQRRYIYATPQDTRMDVTTASRRQVLGLARYMYYNDPVVRGAIDCITRNSIGPGIKCQARTSDEGWNAATEEWFHNWSLACDVRGLLDFNTLQQVACRTMLRDNELFVILTDNGDGWPQLQLVEAHRCETPAYLGADKRISDGVRINAQGRPLSYYIRTGDGDKHRGAGCRRHCFG
jgi:capsid protein